VTLNMGQTHSGTIEQLKPAFSRSLSARRACSSGNTATTPNP
jgi:hypothetical protein